MIARADPSPGRRFLADEMLGKLARWLRFLGHDVAYVKDLGDTAILAAARAESRLVLTRDVELAERARRDPGSLLVAATDPREQLRDVIAALRLPVARGEYLTRCGVCNAVLEPATADEVRDRVPPRIADEQDEFWSCPGCGKVYWPGTHVRRIEETLDGLGEDAE